MNMIADCDACKMRNISVEQKRIDGIDVIICVNWRACINRFKAKDN